MNYTGDDISPMPGGQVGELIDRLGLTATETRAMLLFVSGYSPEAFADALNHIQRERLYRAKLEVRGGAA